MAMRAFLFSIGLGAATEEAEKRRRSPGEHTRMNRFMDIAYNAVTPRVTLDHARFPSKSDTHPWGSRPPGRPDRYSRRRGP